MEAVATAVLDEKERERQEQIKKLQNETCFIGHPFGVGVMNFKFMMGQITGYGMTAIFIYYLYAAAPAGVGLTKVQASQIMHSDVRTSATCVRVSSLRSHSEAIWIETEQPLEVNAVRQAIANADGCTLVDDPQNYLYPMPLESAGKDDIYVGRVRKDLADDHGITLWLTGDQIRKGAALNAVQIAEHLIKVGDVK